MLRWILNIFIRKKYYYNLRCLTICPSVFWAGEMFIFVYFHSYIPQIVFFNMNKKSRGHCLRIKAYPTVHCVLSYLELIKQYKLMFCAKLVLFPQQQNKGFTDYNHDTWTICVSENKEQREVKVFQLHDSSSGRKIRPSNISVAELIVNSTW